MARRLPWLTLLALPAFVVGSVLAVTPNEYRYGTSQTSNLAITNPANSVDVAFNGAMASISGQFGDGPANHWTFTALQDTSLSAIAGVVAEVRFYQSGWVDDAFALEVYDGLTWTRAATYNGANPPPSALTTLSYDVSAALDTVDKVNAAQIRLVGVGKAGPRDAITLLVDGVRLGLEAPATPTATPSPTPTATATATPSLSPTATPTDTATPGDSPTPTATATASPSVTPTPLASSTATPTVTPTVTPTSPPTATPTPTEAPPAGTTNISPDYFQSASPGATVSYTHTVSHLGQSFDYKNLTATSALGWTVALYGADGATPLVDHNSDGIPDTDRLSSGQSATIVVKLTVPAGAPASAQDITTVTASSGRNPIPANSDTATDMTTVNRSISLSLSTTSVDFGLFSPGGEVDGGVAGVSSAIDELGAHYVRRANDGQGAVRVTVTSNGAWTGQCWAGENAGRASTIRVGDGDFAWSLAGESNWTPFTTTAQVPPYDNYCFASRPTGTATYGYDFRLRVEWADRPGTFNSTVTFAVSQ